MKNKNLLSLLILASTTLACACAPVTNSSENVNDSSTNSTSEVTTPDKESSSEEKPSESTTEEKPSESSSSETNNDDLFTGYYASAHGTGKKLRDSLHSIISNRTANSYKYLWTIYKKSDVRPDGCIMDIYSNTTNYKPGDDQDKGHHPQEGISYNREHCIPLSWMNDDNKKNQGCDPFIVLPSDAKVNEERGNFPFGEVVTIDYQSNNGYSKRGDDAHGHTVFEPNDEWKGDMARVYFYASVCYNSSQSWGNGFFTSFNAPTIGLTQSALDLLLKWNKQDPVSDWERHRCDAIYEDYNNRNPFIDHNEFVDMIWGN